MENPLDEFGSHGHRYQRAAIVANPKAGSTTAEYLASVATVCRDYVDEVDIVRTLRPGHATEVVAELLRGPARPDVIVSIGGDGTLREVVTGLVEVASNHTPLVVLPGGTANSNYRSLWDDAPWHEALTAALTGAAESRLIDLAWIAELSRMVVLGLSTGLFAEATARALSLPVSGRPRYQRAIAEALETYQPYEGRVLVDGAVVHSGKIVVANVGGGRYRAGVLNMLPKSIRDDGLLDVCVVDPSIPTTTALELMRSGRHLEAGGSTYARGRSVTLERLDGLPLHFEHDGEVVPTDRSSITVEVLPRALHVLASHQRTGG
ncbi:diacylglycerol/lipid kinase family protein [Streptomyces sp. WM6378]|uniref:diacylglycerol/lipid kinase family protein n=1 Tax=Streptomyces sp. WM6378 TaxID=1415557 RepID=UPI001F3B0C74|nr:diacylglycerol kinase family protein [Streptomyces sp. WM6378]